MADVRKCKVGTALLLASAVLWSSPIAASTCQNTGDFDSWLTAFRTEAAAEGISPNIVSAALNGVTLDQNVIQRDRAQGVFQQSFLEFSDRMVSTYRLVQGEKLMKQHDKLFGRIESEYGVSAPVIVAIWGLESDFGVNLGKFNVVRSLATLAYDCRRSAFFRKQLLDALRILERRDLTIAEMIGNWAGELGPMQFTASDYFRIAVDFDGDGKRNAISSIPDALASAANFLSGHGWKRGKPWLQEVRVPTKLPWEEADLTIRHPRSQWVAWGVTAANGELASDDMLASLLLPMGRLGPAFLAYDNFKAFLGWNAAPVYSATVAYNATRLAGAPPIHRGNGTVELLAPQAVQDLQRLLIRHGLMSTEADGRLGPVTHAAIKQAQIKAGLPADSYPTQELIERLRTSKLTNIRSN
jgi:lytic murein transglycosylase